MKKDTTELVFLLDCSGSMHGLEADTIGGFNGMLETQKAEAGEAYVSTVLFDHETRVLHDRIPIGTVAPLTERDYLVRGSTALLDAVGGAIRHIGNVHRYIRPEDVPEHTLFVIITDGMENASHKYSLREVKRMIERQKEQFGWEFLFLGANIDAVQTAGSFGISEDFAADFCNDSEGTALNFKCVSQAIHSVRMAEPLSGDWKAEIEEDYKKRGRKKRPHRRT